MVIAYADIRTNRQAKRACDFLAQNLSHEWRVIRQMWMFELLGNPELRKIAAEEAAMSEVIMIACHSNRELPADVRAWIELWAGQEVGAVALVAILDGAPAREAAAPRTEAYLESVAKRAGMEFFAWPQVWLKQRSRSRRQGAKAAQETLLRAA